MQIEEKGDSLVIPIIMQPRSSKNTITLTKEAQIKIHLTAPPVDGEANKQLIDFLSRKLSVSRSRISILHGLHSRKKVISIYGMNKQQFMKELNLSTTQS